MTIIELGALGEFVGSVAVLWTLVYLAIQIRQNTQTGKAAVIQASADRSTRAWMISIENPQLAEAMRRANEGDEITGAEQQMLHAMAMVLLRNYEASVRTQELGLMETSAIDTTRIGMEMFLAGAYFSSWWMQNRLRFSASFRDHVDELVAGPAAVPG